MKIPQICVGALVLAWSAVAPADVKPNQLFSDHAVLQSGMSIPVWGTADPGEKVTVTLGKRKKSTMAGSDGRWIVRLGKLAPGGPFVMTIAGKNIVTVNDVLVGQDWIGSGQSNMAFTVSAKAASFAGMLDEDKEIAAADYPQLRIFMAAKKSYEPQNEIEGEWKIATAENAPAFSAVAYLFGRDLNQALKEPVGIVVVAFGASTAESWISRPAIAGDPEMKPMLVRFDELYSFYKTHPGATTDQAPPAPQTINSRPGRPTRPLRDPVQDQHQPTVLYNGMVHPIIPFAMRGVIWYQGESIVGGRTGVALYPHTMEALVKDWRAEWGEGNFLFYCVQLPPLKNASNNPMVREGQAKLLDLPNTGMAVTLDVGDPTNVHPKNKEPVGDRLSRIALAKVYGRKIEFSGPVFKGAKVEGANIVVRFSHADGLTGKDGPLQWFQVAGADGKYVSATATVQGRTVVVHSDQVPSPFFVRYAWSNYPQGANLINAAGLPAAPFRTDSQDALATISKEFTGK